MRIFGIGTDIIRVERFNKFLKEANTISINNNFLKRVMHTNEIKELQIRANKSDLDKPRFFAKKWAAKEAVSKALGVGIGKYLHLNEIETLNDEFGKPIIRLHGDSLKYIRKNNISEIMISITDEKEIAVAFAIAICN